MIISKSYYKKLVTQNKNLKDEVEELENQIKYLKLANDTYYKGAIKWRHMYDEMRELYDHKGIKNPIVDQRDAEIEALKHMLERVETEHKDTKIAVKALNKDNDNLVKELSECQGKLAFLHDMFKTKLEIAELYHDANEMAMWRGFLKEVEE